MDPSRCVRGAVFGNLRLATSLGGTFSILGSAAARQRLDQKVATASSFQRLIKTKVVDGTL